MQPTTLSLIEAVDRQRTKRQMSDRKFSIDVLDISPAYYCLLKRGRRRITLNILNIFKEKLPEVTPEVTIFFMSQGGDGKNKKTLKKSGDKTASDYLGHGNQGLPPKKPSKNASGGKI